MKTTPAFKQTIQDYLEKRVIEDPLFATSYSNPKKNIDDCVTYILNTVKNSGINGYTDDEVFNMAVHYYDEETIDIGAEINCQVVVNHKVELTEEEKAEAKEKAIRELINKEKDILKQKPILPKVEIKKTDIKEIQTSLF
jgi:predicted Zn-dependent protease